MAEIVAGGPLREASRDDGISYSSLNQGFVNVMVTLIF
jgi:hypothetical protein